MNATVSDEMTAYLASVHRQVKDIDGHAIELWEDGEITSTKCNRGELYGQRGLHSLSAGNPEQALPVDVFPGKCNGHGFVRLASYEEAVKVRDTLCWPE